MKVYHDALQYILDNGETRYDRTGVGTKSAFGYQMRFNLQEGFPAITTKRLAWKAVVAELLWFLEGSTDERRLAQIQFKDDWRNKNTIWTANADAQGKALGYENNDDVKELGPVYGKQWRDFNGVDQISQLINNIKTDPWSRRHLLSAWNVGELDQMTLPPCHLLVQFYVTTDYKLNCQLYQRSADMFLGVPFNIASYSLLTHIIAKLTDLQPGEFVHTIGDAHVYLNHVDQVTAQLKREERPLPTLEIPNATRLQDFLGSNVENFYLHNYNPHPTIKADMAV